ncbi:MAG: glycoside hydrolase family protein [Candidatus Cloacimonetes bacterium]|jgi:lysozyme|nr:glycoside hydrolase family protein [Candidatus Cloacimonadota bacterium]
MISMQTYIKRNEGLRLKPYRCQAGKLTIGYGRNLEAKGISIKEAEYLFRNDINIVTKQVAIRIEFYRKLSYKRKLVLVDMAFNMGIEGLLGFKKMLAAMKSGDFREAGKELMRSKYAEQVKTRALQNYIYVLEG